MSVLGVSNKLSDMEERLISLQMLFMSIYELTRGEQYGQKHGIVNAPIHSYFDTIPIFSYNPIELN